MNNRRIQIACLCLPIFSAGCAVTEPTEMDTKRVRSAIDEDPSTSIELLSQRLGVSELAVVRAMPQKHARRWPDSPSAAWSAVQAWPVAFVDTPHTTYFVEPALVYIEAHENTPVFGGELLVKLKWEEVQEVWLIRQPGANLDLNAVWWFDESGKAVFRVRLPALWNDGQNPLMLYEQMWSKATHADLD